MRLKAFLITLILCILIELPVATSVWAQDKSEATSALSENQLAPIAEIVEEAIVSGKIPGAVILIGNQGKVVYCRAFGHQVIDPKKLPMRIDTIFDLGSLTKVIATTTALMQLVEKGKLRLEDRVTTHWPEFKANGKEEITVRQLLTHYSGLRPTLNLKPEWTGYSHSS